METVNQGNEPQEPERTFTQAEVDRIVKDRLTRDRADRADYDELKEKAKRLDEIEEANKTELEKATSRADSLQKELDKLKTEQNVRTIREKVAEEKGIPVKLLTASTEEDCAAQADEILKFAKPQAYPSVPDGGEAHVTMTKDQSTRDRFADWFNQQL